jgi:hypothetical protein
VTAPRPQLTIQAPQSRRKPVEPARAPRRAISPTRPHTFCLPEVREIPRRAAGGPWEAGW